MANWSFYQVWLAIFFYMPLLAYGLWNLIKRNIIGLGIILWLGVMFAYLNIMSPVVGIVADRFTYVFSLGFCIVVGYLLFKIFKIDLNNEVSQLKIPNGFIISVLVIMVVYSGRVLIRNPNWHDYLTLYYNDIEVVPNSAKAHALISNTLYGAVAKKRQDPKNPQYIDEIIKHFKKAVEIDSTYLTSLGNLGSAYIDLRGDYKTGILYCSKAIEKDSNYFEANLNLGIAYDRLNQPDSAYKYYMRAVEIDPVDGRPYTFLNKFLSKYGRVDVGISQLKQLAKVSENPKNIYMNIANLYSLDVSSIDKLIMYFVKAFDEDSTDKILCGHIANLYLRVGNQEKANYYTSIQNKLK
jgi:tetratricopeptide (TPR) repeat protein